MDSISIRRIRIRSALKFGLAVGAVVACLPGLLFGLVGASAVSLLRGWLQSWQTIRVNLLIETLEFDLIQLLQIGQTLEWLQVWDQRKGLIVFGLTLGTMILAGLVAALMTGLAGAVYNGIARLSGGIEVEVEERRAGMLTAEHAGMLREPTAALPSLSPAAWLVLAADPSRYWLLAQQVSRVGSQPDNEVVLPFEGIGAIHAEIRLEGGRYVLYDRSDGQVWVNGRPIAGRNLLKDGFQVRLGAVGCIFRQQEQR